MSDNHTVCVFWALADTSSKEKAIKKHFKQLLEKLPPYYARRNVSTWNPIFWLKRGHKADLLCAERAGCNSGTKESPWIASCSASSSSSRILSQWKVPHINPRCGIVILTRKTILETGNNSYKSTTISDRKTYMKINVDDPGKKSFALITPHVR